MKKQPDFAGIFKSHFGNIPSKIRYRVRGNSNRDHDIIFLSSLIHDARFNLCNIMIKGKRLTLLLDRDCWELGITNHNGVGQLYITQSQLTISPVTEIKWEFMHGSPIQPDDELWINEVRLVQQFRKSEENIDFVLYGSSWQSTVTIIEPKMLICLADKEMPHF